MKVSQFWAGSTIAATTNRKFLPFDLAETRPRVFAGGTRRAVAFNFPKQDVYLLPTGNPDDPQNPQLPDEVLSMNLFALADTLHDLSCRPVAELNADELELWFTACKVMEQKARPLNSRGVWKRSRLEAEAELSCRQATVNVGR